MKPFQKSVKIFRKLSGVWGIIGAVGLFSMAAITFIDVLMRYFIHHPIVGSQEMAQFLMIIAMFGGMPVAAARGSLLSVDALTKNFHPGLRKGLKLFFSVLCAVTSVLMCEKNFEQVQYYMDNPLLRSSILKWSYTPFYIFTSVGLVFLSVELILEVFLLLHDFRKRNTADAMGEEGKVHE